MIIPALSQKFFSEALLQNAVPACAMFRSVWVAMDHSLTRSDPSNCAWISSFGGGVAVGWMAKLAIDADGRAVEPGFRDGEQLDPEDGQDATSLRFADGSALDSEGCPYYVLPGGAFGQGSGLKLGDVGVVIYKDILTAAMLGDTGPRRKIGEGSIRLHNNLRPAAPDPCAHRDDEDRCTLIRNASIESGVVAIFFRESGIKGLMEATAQEQIERAAFKLWNSIGGKLDLLQQALLATEEAAS
jgi:hypothetical protein